MTQTLPIADGLIAGRDRFRGFMSQIISNEHVVIFCDADADGLAAGALLGRSLPRTGVHNVDVVVVRRGESAFSREARQRLRALAPDMLIVTDLGVHRDGVLEDIPTLYIDHHQPFGEPPGAVVISGYDWDPIPSSAWLTFELLRTYTDVSDLDWIAAVGTISDLGEKAPWSELSQIRRRYTSAVLKEAVVLINAARRAAEANTATPLRLLMESSHPRAVSDDASDVVAKLRGYRAQVNAELSKARRHAPRFSTTGPYALVLLHSACQIHPLIAQQWRGRLRDYAVIAANTGYLPGVVAFSMRTARVDLNLPQLLQSIDLGEFGGRYGHGHDQASGGQIPPEAFKLLLERLGFPPAAIPDLTSAPSSDVR